MVQGPEVGNVHSAPYFNELDRKLKSKHFSTDGSIESVLKDGFEELLKDITTPSVSPEISVVVLEMVGLASRDQIERLLEKMISNYKLFFVNENAGYVLRRTVFRAVEFFDDEEVNVVMDLVYQLGSVILKRTDLHCNAWVSNPVRSLLEVMSGVNSPKKVKPKHMSIPFEYEMKEHDYYSRFSDLLHEFTPHVLPMSESALGMMRDKNLCELSSQLLDIFYKKERKHCTALCEKMLEGGVLDKPNKYGTPFLFCTHPNTLCGVLMAGLPQNKFDEVFEKFVLPLLNLQLEHQPGKPAVTASLLRLHTDKQFLTVCKSLHGKIWNYLCQSGSRRVVAALCEAAVDHPSWQTEVMNLFKHAMGDSESNFIVCLVERSAHPVLGSSELTQNLTEAMKGSFFNLLQALSKYEDTSILRASFSKLPPKMKAAVAKNSLAEFFLPIGSQGEGQEGNAEEVNRDSSMDKPAAEYVATNDEFVRLRHQFSTFKGEPILLRSLFGEVSDESVQCFLRGLLQNYEPFVNEDFGMYAIEAFVSRATHFFDDNEENVVMDLVHQLGSTMLEHKKLLSLVKHLHAIQAVVLAMSGVRSPNIPDEARSAEHDCLMYEMKEHNFYHRFSKLLHKFSDQILPISPSTYVRATDVTKSSKGMQLLCIFSEKDPEFGFEVCRKIMDSGLLVALQGKRFRLVWNKVGGLFTIPFTDAMSPALFEKYFDEYIVTHFHHLLKWKFGPFAITAAFSRVHSDEQFHAVFQRVKGKLFALLQPQSCLSYFISGLCKLASNHPSWQTALMDAWKEEMGGSKTNFIVAICLAGPVHNFDDNKLWRKVCKMSSTQEHSIIAMAKYEDTSYLCTHFEELPVLIKLGLAQCSRGQNVIANVLNSPTVPSKTKTSFLTTPQDFIRQLIEKDALSVLQLWELSNLPVKIELMSILAGCVSSVSATADVAQLAASTNLQKYTKNRSEWDEWVANQGDLNSPDEHSSQVVADAQPGKKRKTGEATDEDVQGQTTPVAKKKKRSERKKTESASQDEEMDTEVPSTPAVKSPESTEDVPTPVKVAASSKKSAKKVAKLAEDAPTAEQETSTPVASAKKSKKKTPKTLKKLEGTQ